jgi:hypothetical protein
MPIKRNDKTGAKRGAGPYSRSYYETTDKPPPGFAGSYPKPTPAAQGMGNTGSSIRGAAPTVQDLIAGKDISGRVFSVGNRKGGYSAEVSSNKRPAHKQGSWRRV